MCRLLFFICTRVCTTALCSCSDTDTYLLRPCVRVHVPSGGSTCTFAQFFTALNVQESPSKPAQRSLSSRKTRLPQPRQHVWITYQSITPSLPLIYTVLGCFCFCINFFWVRVLSCDVLHIHLCCAALCLLIYCFISHQ